MVAPRASELEWAGSASHPDGCRRRGLLASSSQIETSSTTASRCSSRPTPACGKGTRPGWTDGLYDVHAAGARHRRTAARSTADAMRRSSRCSGSSSSTARSTLPTPRTSRLPVGMAAYRGDPQPPQAPQPPDRRRPRLGKRRRAAAHPPRTPSAAPAKRSCGISRQPRVISALGVCVLPCVTPRLGLVVRGRESSCPGGARALWRVPRLVPHAMLSMRSVRGWVVNFRGERTGWPIWLRKRCWRFVRG